jgi:short-subunit dehydrogenase
MTSLSGKYVLITGGSRGLGPLIAEALASRGAHIALAARSEAGLAAVAGSLSRYPVQTIIVPVDLADTKKRIELVSTVLKKFGRIDILINNAGLETEGAYLELPWEEIQKTIDVNLTAPMALTYLVLPSMLKQNQGHVVNIASIAAKCGIALAATYCGTKAGLAEWTSGLRLELEGSGVHFSTILPGYVKEVGMFARFNIIPHTLAGSCTPAQVVKAVLKAIVRNKSEVIINSTPTRLLFAINEISPSSGDWLKKKLGLVEFQRKKVLQKGDNPPNFIS